MYTRYRFKLRLILSGLILLPLSKRHNTTQITYKFVLCLLSNASMLAIKCIYACYQMCICLLSNEFLLTVKYAPSPPNHPRQTAIDHTKEMLTLAKTITTIQIKLPLNKEVYTQTMLMARHQKIAKLFDEEFQTIRLKRAESPKALSPGHRPGYNSNL